MQTFLPLPSFEDSAACLDYRRLGKQRVEVYQILRSLRGETTGWARHPAARMWAGHEYALGAYGNAILAEWVRRGYKNSMDQFCPSSGSVRLPNWFGDPDFHASHRSNLLRKDPVYYGRYGWAEASNLPYIWPVSKPKELL